MAKDNGEESLPEDESELEWSEPEGEPESPALVDHAVETTEDEPDEPMVTYVRQPNGRLIPYRAGMDNR